MRIKEVSKGQTALQPKYPWIGIYRNGAAKYVVLFVEPGAGVRLNGEDSYYHGAWGEKYCVPYDGVFEISN